MSTNFSQSMSKIILLMLGTIAIGNAAIFSTATQANALERLNNQMADRVNLKTDSTFLVAKKPQPGKPATRGKLPTYVLEAYRDIKTHPAQGKVYNNAGGHGGQQLPALSRGEEYREHDVINPKDKGNRGAYRIVTKVDEKSKKLIKAYYTGNHYKTFEPLD